MRPFQSYPFEGELALEVKTAFHRIFYVMVHVKVIFPGYLASKSGKIEVTVDLVHGNIVELLDILKTSYPIAEDFLNSAYFLAVNDEMVNRNDFSNYPLQDGDKITFVFAIAGG